MPVEETSTIKWMALAALVLSTVIGMTGFKGQFMAMLEKPQHTVTVWPCVIGNCGRSLASCVADAACRNTLGKKCSTRIYKKYLLLKEPDFHYSLLQQMHCGRTQ